MDRRSVVELNENLFNKLIGTVTGSIIPIPPVTPTMVILLEKKKQIILYGPPGTGKTCNTKKIAINLLTRSTR